MPIYEYICDNCGEEHEVIQKISDKPLELCPSCNNNSLKKKTSMSAFHLKGGGWYKDGYGNGSSEKSANGTTSSPKDDSSASTNASSTSETSKDTAKAPASSEKSTSSSETKAPQSKAS